jgi:hypothetical protein
LRAEALQASSAKAAPAAAAGRAGTEFFSVRSMVKICSSSNKYQEDPCSTRDVFWFLLLISL